MDHKLYLSDQGIYRQGLKFYFNKNKKEVVDSKILQRVNKFVVPPAWKNVWYATSSRCHIQVHGIDQGGKKQYILSEQWIKNAHSEKFNRMKKFIRDLASFKKKIKLKTQTVNKENLIHLLFNLLIDLHIRVGNEIYAEQNKTYGLTTLRQKHLKFKDNKYLLQFVGKSNIEHSIDIPLEYNSWFTKLKDPSSNKPLFYYDNFQTINSEELNDYLKKFMGKEYTCKDFRTYSANMLFIKAFLKKKKRLLKTNQQNFKPKKIVLSCIDETAHQLGHTRSIARKSYISERLLDYCLDSFDEASELSSSELLSKVWST